MVLFTQKMGLPATGNPILHCFTIGNPSNFPFLPFMEHFRNDYKERGIESSLDIL